MGFTEKRPNKGSYTPPQTDCFSWPSGAKPAAADPNKDDATPPRGADAVAIAALIKRRNPTPAGVLTVAAVVISPATVGKRNSRDNRRRTDNHGGHPAVVPPVPATTAADSSSTSGSNNDHVVLRNSALAKDAYPLPRGDDIERIVTKFFTKGLIDARLRR